MQGNLQVVYIKIGTFFEPIGCLTSNDFDLSIETFDTTTRVDGLWNNSLPDSASYQISLQGILDLTKRSGQTVEIFARNRTIFDWALGSNGVYYRTGKGYFSSYSDTAPVNNKITFSALIIGKGSYELILPQQFALQANTTEALEVNETQGLNTD